MRDMTHPHGEINNGLGREVSSLFLSFFLLLVLKPQLNHGPKRQSRTVARLRIHLLGLISPRTES